MSWHDSVIAARSTSTLPGGHLERTGGRLSLPAAAVRMGGRGGNCAWPGPPQARIPSRPIPDRPGPRFTACDPRSGPAAIPEGQVIEIHPAYPRLAACTGRPRSRGLHVADHRLRGYLARPVPATGLRGTLRGYVVPSAPDRGRAFCGPGNVDLTCDVNFTDLQAWGTDAGAANGRA